MNISIERIIKSEVNVEVINSAISYSNTLNTLDEVCVHIKMKIASISSKFLLDDKMICGKESNHIWVAYKESGERILIITI